MTDPNIEAWKRAHGTLGSRLVDLESHANVAVARAGSLTGSTAAAWADADAGLVHAWATFRVLADVLAEVDVHPDRAPALLTTSQIPGADGATADPSTALSAASQAIDTAMAVAERLDTAWNELAPRVGAARATAAASGDSAAERSATALAELVATDPFAVTEADVAAVEQQVSASSARHEQVQAALARLDVDLVQARETVTALEADARAAVDELAHAATRIAGIDATTAPVGDLDALGTWLGRIEATAAAGDRSRAATDLHAWQEAARARRTELDAALEPARSGLHRRDEGQGLWTALRAKAGALRLDERPEVADALTAARDELWRAPCDLAAAEASLARLSEVLTARPKEDR
jgi:hypothetical protein